MMQKAFIQIPILIVIIALVVVSGTTTGIVLHKQKQNSASSFLSANVAEQIYGASSIQSQNSPDNIESNIESKTEIDVISPAPAQQEPEPEEEPKEPEQSPQHIEPEVDPCIVLNCDNSDGCYGNNYLDYYCFDNSCVKTEDDCSDCSCSCGGYNIDESIENNNCDDGKDNDCDEQTDSEDQDCIIQGTYIEGIISKDTTWERKNSPYIISDDVLIEKNIILDIEPGTIIKFQKGEGRSNFGGFEILNKGTITAKGNQKNKIIFTSAETYPNLGDWGTIEIVGGGSINFDNVKIEYASYGINAANALSAVITNSYFSNCGQAIFTSGPAIISNNIIENNNSGVDYCGCTYSARDDGDFSYSGDKEIKIENNIIRNNMGQPPTTNPYHAGIVISDCVDSGFLTISHNNIYNNSSGINILCNLSAAKVEKNNIYDNHSFSIYTTSQGTEVNMPNNWWGTTDASIIDSLIHDFNDNYILPLIKINYQPIATSEIPDAGVQ